MYNRYIPSEDGTYRRQRMEQSVPAQTTEQTLHPMSVNPHRRTADNSILSGKFDSEKLLLIVILLLLLTDDQDDDLVILIAALAFLIL